MATLLLWDTGDHHAGVWSVVELLWGAIALCLLNTTEEILMTLMLDQWHCDVLSIFHAYGLIITANNEGERRLQYVE